MEFDNLADYYNLEPGTLGLALDIGQKGIRSKDKDFWSKESARPILVIKKGTRDNFERLWRQFLEETKLKLDSLLSIIEDTAIPIDYEVAREAAFNIEPSLNIVERAPDDFDVFVTATYLFNALYFSDLLFLAYESQRISNVLSAETFGRVTLGSSPPILRYFPTPNPTPHNYTRMLEAERAFIYGFGGLYKIKRWTL